MGLIEILEEMSKEEGFEGVELRSNLDFRSCAYIGLKKDRKKTVLNQEILKFENIISENPEYLLGFLHGILHEDGHKQYPHDVTKHERIENLCEKHSIKELKRRGIDPVEAKAYDSILLALIRPSPLGGIGPYISRNLKPLGFLERRRAMKLVKQKIKYLLSRYQNVPKALSSLYS